MHAHAKPDVAVITPTDLLANRLSYLEELYESLLGQEGVAWEWVVAPNGPQADPDLVPAAITRDPRVKVVARSGSGPAPARNTALNYVWADRVAFADDDDRLPPWSLAIHHEHAIATGVHWVAGRSADWDAASGSCPLGCARPPSAAMRQATSGILAGPHGEQATPGTLHAADRHPTRSRGRARWPPQGRGLQVRHRRHQPQ
ncbi:glycosyltransferase family A protein [Streptomyces sp. NPDC005904]|uniref:glycosyltransferase family 2 protein n=1 Tax=Streptomyces sp. NPDC005904 TaxID=3154570 RepID=UPI0033CE8E8B